MFNGKFLKGMFWMMTVFGLMLTAIVAEPPTTNGINSYADYSENHSEYQEEVMNE